MSEAAQGQSGCLEAMSQSQNADSNLLPTHIPSYHGYEGMATLPNGLTLSLKSSTREILRPLKAACSMESPWPLSCAWSLHRENCCFLPRASSLKTHLPIAPLQIWTRGHQGLQGALGLLRTLHRQVGTGVDSSAWRFKDLPLRSKVSNRGWVLGKLSDL